MNTTNNPQNMQTKAPGRVPLKVIGIIYIVLGGLMVAGLFYDVAAIGVMPVLYAVLRLFVGIYGVAMCDNLAKADNLQALAVFNLFLTVSWRGAGVFAVLGIIVLSICFLVGAVKNRKAYVLLQRSCGKITLKKASLSDARQLYAMQIKAFKPLLDKYRDYETNPGAEKIKKTISRLSEQGSHYYFIQIGDLRIGAVRVKGLGDVCKLKQIYILPEYQGSGYAQTAILLVESLHENAVTWKLDTIKQEEKLCHLYKKMGYRQTGKEEKVKDGMDILFYEKEVD